MSDRIKIRPGLLVQLSTRVEGGVTYTTKDIDEDVGGVTERKVWETERVIEDVEEHTLATQTRGKVRQIIATCCAWTPFGLICPTEDEPALDAAIAEARALVDTFNAGSVHSKVKFSHLRGTIAANQADAIAAVRFEIAELMERLDAAVKTGKVEDIRDCAKAATQMGRLLDQGSDASEKLKKALARARQVATTINKRVTKQGEDIAAVMAEISLAPISMARFAFSTSSDDAPEMIDEPVMGEQLPLVNAGRFSNLADDTDGGDA